MKNKRRGCITKRKRERSLVVRGERNPNEKERFPEKKGRHLAPAKRRTEVWKKKKETPIRYLTFPINEGKKNDPGEKQEEREELGLSLFLGKKTRPRAFSRDQEAPEKKKRNTHTRQVLEKREVPAGLVPAYNGRGGKRGEGRKGISPPPRPRPRKERKDPPSSGGPRLGARRNG